MLLLLILRSTLTVSANSNGITGGMFVPILVLGAVLSAIIGELLEQITELSPDYYTLILALGITACISGMMKMPLTAILFSIEALSCYDNILSVILVSAITFIITEIFGTKSINESVLENKMKGLNNNRKLNVIDTFVTVQRGAFAIGKQIRDIFWPANLFVLSLRHNERQSAQVDEHGGKIIKQGDILHIRYSTFDENETRHELTAIVGQQEYEENQIDII